MISKILGSLEALAFTFFDAVKMHQNHHSLGAQPVSSIGLQAAAVGIQWRTRIVIKRFKYHWVPCLLRKCVLEASLVEGKRYCLPKMNMLLCS